MGFRLQQWNRMSGKTEFDVLEQQYLYSSDQITWWMGEVASCWEEKHCAWTINFFLSVPATSTLTSCESTVKPLSIAPHSISRKGMISVGQQQLQESIKICQNIRNQQKNENFLFSTYSYVNEREVSCKSLFSTKKSVIHSCLVQVLCFSQNGANSKF